VCLRGDLERGIIFAFSIEFNGEGEGEREKQSWELCISAHWVNIDFTDIPARLKEKDIADNLRYSPLYYFHRKRSKLQIESIFEIDFCPLAY
jgi:hypothetical protein